MAKPHAGVRPVDEATRNVQTLAACKGHRFEPRAGLAHARRYRCLACGGEIDNAMYVWYVAGRRDQKAAQESPKPRGDGTDGPGNR